MLRNLSQSRDTQVSDISSTLCMVIVTTILVPMTVFFLVCSEISTIPLIFIDIGKFFPPVPGTIFDTIVFICGVVFALAFTYYRVFLWWKVSFQMFVDILGVLKDGTAEKFRPGRNHVLYIMMGLNLLLGCLQIYWFSVILGEASVVLGFSTNDNTQESSKSTEF